MNDQFNNYNSQFNNQPPVSGDNPTQHTKRKFFTSSVMDSVNVDAVGGTTSGSVVSWSAGGPRNNGPAVSSFAQQQTMTGANGVDANYFGQQQNSNQFFNQVSPNTMQMPALAQNNVPWPQPTPEVVNNNQFVNQGGQEMPVEQTMPLPIPQVQTNSLGMALAEPLPPTPQIKDETVEMLSEVNGDVYVDEPEVLDFDESKGESDEPIPAAPLPKVEPVSAPTNDNSSNYLAEKYQEQQKFERDQLSNGNFASLMGNSNASTFAPGMSKKEEAVAVPVVPVPPVAPVLPAAAAAAGTVLNAAPKPDLGITPTQANANAYNDNMLSSTPIFQAATEVLDEAPVQGVNPEIANQHVEGWMGSQPLSENNFKPDKKVDVNSYSGVADSKKEETVDDKKKKKKKKKDTEPVPEDAIKKQEAPIRVDNMASEIVGSKYTHFVMSPFNLAALFFGPSYMAYRRMPLAAIVVYAINVGVVFFAPLYAPDKYYTIAQFGAIIGFALLYALSVNRMIVANAKFKAKTIVKRFGENGSHDDAVIMAKRMGRPSLIMGLLFIILSAVISGLLLTTVLKDSKLANLYNIYMDAYQNGGTVEYNGIIKYSDYDVSSAVDIDVPKGFTKVDNMSYTYITEGEGRYNDCSFHIYAVDRFINGETFIKKMAEFNGDSDKVTSKEINGIDWTNYYTEDSMYKIYYRGFTYKNHAIVFEYKSGRDASEGVCDQLYVEVMDGIQIKEG